ncbi:MAG TPA: amylo-alpha-1,6-glucosidase [Methylomirabilota bacterium]|nr:amylo-alpha-1,6-glucosidase [Methylomirabilota bacterium]
MLSFGRELTGDLRAAEAREWLCTNGAGSFASGTVAGTLTRRYHGLLMAALEPPFDRRLLVAKVEEIAEYLGETFELGTNRWASGVVAPVGHRFLEAFRLEDMTPIWTFACADALIEKRVWMEQGQATTYVRYQVLRASGAVALTLKCLVDCRDFHATTQGQSAGMSVEVVPDGLAVTAFAGAPPLRLLSAGARAEIAQEWYRGYFLAREDERGLDHLDDHFHAGTFRARLESGRSLTIACSAEPAPSADGEAAWDRRQGTVQSLRRCWDQARPGPAPIPAWVGQLVLAADQFIVGRPLPELPAGRSIIAGYPWFEEWGRDAMIAVTGLAVATGRPEIARRILTTASRFVDRGMLPNRVPDATRSPEYNTADAALWFIEAVRAYHTATGDDPFLARLFPVVEDIVGWYRRGTRFGIGEDPADGLLRAGVAGAQVTWMDAKIGDFVVTPRIGKPVEINALWHSALWAGAGFARRLGKPHAEWEERGARAGASFARFWNESAACCYDVIDGPAGPDPAVRPNQIFAVSMAVSPLPPSRQRAIVEICARRLLTSFGLRSLDPANPAYRGRYTGGPRERDSAYHQGTVWGWLLGPFALAHLKVHGDAGAAASFLEPMGHALAAYGLGTLGEVFDGEPPFRPGGCPAQAWTVAETLRAWVEIDAVARRQRG